MRRFLWISMIAMASMFSACAADEPNQGGGDDYASASEEQSLQQHSDALKINPCALVRCRAGTQCEVQNGRAVCVPTPAPECTSDKECRLFSNYCGGCSCQALADGEVDPVCKGDLVACLVDPCMNATPSCVRGQCVLGGSF
jgi:hypothetical protein